MKGRLVQKYSNNIKIEEYGMNCVGDVKGFVVS